MRSINVLIDEMREGLIIGRPMINGLVEHAPDEATRERTKQLYEMYDELEKAIDEVERVNTKIVDFVKALVI